jgi:L-alanine-DL-glutamate epimerase-like enolase superfamily enzyme
MKITQVEIFIYKLDQHYQVRGSEETPGLLPETDYFFEPHWRQAYSRRVESCLIKLTTDTGLHGWGEAQAPILPESPASILQHLVGPFLLGRDPLQRAVIADQLYHINNIRGHESGFTLDALAAVDIALWDIAGKHHGVPVSQLLGGPFRSELSAYISGLRQPSLDEQAVAAREYIDEGFDGIKLFIGHGLAADRETVARIRASVDADTRLFADCLWRYRVDEAMRLGRTLDDCNYEFLEAPLSPEDLAGHRQLVQGLDLSIAVGEAMRTAWEFAPWIAEPRSLGVAQPDIVRCGITNAVKISHLCEAHRIPVAPHVGVCTGIGMAATWQYAASIPNFLIQEYQLQLCERANAILSTPLEARDGKLIVPDRPGLGVDIDEDALATVTDDHTVIG